MTSLKDTDAAQAIVVEELAADPVDRVLESVRAVSPRPVVLPQLATARVASYDAESDTLTLRIGDEAIPARRDESLHKVVLEGAASRGERVLVEQHNGELLVVGAVRTQPTPGIDHAPSYDIHADRIHIAAEEELALTARTASVVLRALGEVETLSDRIISRAEGVHKIIGRMLRLN